MSGIHLRRIRWFYSENRQSLLVNLEHFHSFTNDQIDLFPACAHIILLSFFILRKRLSILYLFCFSFPNSSRKVAN